MSAKRTAVHFLFLVICCMSLHAVSTVDFFSTVSDSQDKNMISMTTDLFYTQLLSIEGFTVVDKRDIVYNIDNAQSDISFYAEIQESGDGSWICTLHAIKNSTGKTVNETKNYLSYYKILLDAKTSLEKVLKAFDSTNEIKSQNFEYDKKNDNSLIEQLSGTWTGEALIDKVIVLRGGKGFVIFKNGASMNINVSIIDNSIIVKQSAKSNASFFPELPRNIALQNAADASPIIWKLNLTENGTLKGTKITLLEDRNSESGASAGEILVEWKKK